MNLDKQEDCLHPGRTWARRIGLGVRAACLCAVSLLPALGGHQLPHSSSGISSVHTLWLESGAGLGGSLCTVASHGLGLGCRNSPYSDGRGCTPGGGVVPGRFNSSPGDQRGLGRRGTRRTVHVNSLKGFWVLALTFKSPAGVSGPDGRPGAGQQQLGGEHRPVRGQGQQPDLRELAELGGTGLPLRKLQR